MPPITNPIGPRIPDGQGAISALEQGAIRKASHRILPLVFVIYLVAFLDRANVAYAKLTMSGDLGFSERVYGFGAGLFFIGYLVLEVPGALIAHRWGARRWIVRILASWGICTALVGFVHTPHQFYLARFVLGLAEAGLVPAVLVYLHEWFPAQYRARALARFFMASSFALALGGPIAGLILKLNWLGMPAWRWLFILEGIPALVLAVVSLFTMVDRPQQATWLSAEERSCIVQTLEKERAQKFVSRPLSIWDTLRHRDVLLLSTIGFFSNIGIAGFFLWLPSTLRNASTLTSSQAAALSGVPFASAVASVLCMSYSSDRSGERRLHTAIPLILAGLVFPVTTLANLSLMRLVCWLCLSAAAIYGFVPSFWMLPSRKLADSSGAAAFGFLNIANGLGSFVGPSVVGLILTAKFSYSVAVMFLSACFLLAGICALAVHTHR
jgi:MFS transporter, ACS family, tartrate transporter